MNTVVQEDKKFEAINYSENKLIGPEFVNCEFINCNFSKTNLMNIDFIECSFKDCDFSLAVLNGTGFKDVRFTTCKLMGLDFAVCNDFLFTVDFRDCMLDYSSFFKKKIKQTNFIDCLIQHADFTEADLTLAVFKNSDLLSTVFSRTVLEKTDFRTAKNYSIDPELNKVKKAKFSHLGLSGLLHKYNLDITFE